jgi:hypothetical protein
VFAAATTSYLPLKWLQLLLLKILALLLKWRPPLSAGTTCFFDEIGRA